MSDLKESNNPDVGRWIYRPELLWTLEVVGIPADQIRRWETEDPPRTHTWEDCRGATAVHRNRREDR